MEHCCMTIQRRAHTLIMASGPLCSFGEKQENNGGKLCIAYNAIFGTYHIHATKC
jgi:hypothetical protein